jgi:hypothetical protein
MHDLSAQLEMFGLDGAKRLAETATTSARERSRLLRRIDVTHELMSELPAGVRTCRFCTLVCAKPACRIVGRARTTQYGSASPDDSR